MAMLATAAPDVRVATKGAIRTLDGSHALSFERVSVVGASLSAGFGGTPLGEAFDEAITVNHQVTSSASTLFFRDPIENGRQHIDQAIADEATLVIAFDILFWYAYAPRSLEGRMARLEQGLANLERLEVPIVLGDLPDMRSGAEWMLPPTSVPPPEQLEVLNDRIHQWAQDRMNVHLVPLAEWSAALATDGDIEVVPGEKPVPAKDLVTADGLHPNPRGVRYMLLRLEPSLEAAFPGTPKDALKF